MVAGAQARTGHPDAEDVFGEWIEFARKVFAGNFAEVSHWIVDASFAAVLLAREEEVVEVLPEVPTRWHVAAIAVLRKDAMGAADVLAEIGCPGYEAEARAVAARSLAGKGHVAAADEQAGLACALYTGLSASAAIARLDAALENATATG